VRLAIVWAVLLGSGCSGNAPTEQADGEALADGGPGGLCVGSCLDSTADVPVLVTVEGILGAVCANPDGCHGGGAGNLSIAGRNDFSHLIDAASSEMPAMLRVQRFDPEHSYMYRKLACEGGIIGSCMPPGGRLDPSIVRAFHDWIEAGAPAQ
jgi:hypothetical protein